MRRTIFFVSDGTGLTAETLGHSLITQFEDIDFTYSTFPYVDSEQRAAEVVTTINAAYNQDGKLPIVFATLVNPCIRDILAESKSMFMDFFSTFIGPLENELQSKSSYTIGKTHSVHDPKDYTSRIDAINYTLNTDDGVNLHQYSVADLILVGVSRSGKTPTCLYLSLQFGVKAANYPITEEDLQHRDLPKALIAYKPKLFGLIIDPIRLQTIRKERRPESRYASLAQCQIELRMIDQIFKRHKIPYLNTTNLSIEEIATKIMATLGIARRLQ